MARISPIPSTRVSDMFAHQRLLSQLQSDQIDVLRLQQQISTGRRIQVLSEDAPAGMRAVTLQRLMEQKIQIKQNLQINQDFLSTTDTALSDVSNQLAKAKAGALGVTGAVATDVERETVAKDIDRTLEDLLNTANENYRGRYLFAGSRTAELPFEQKGNYIRYNGNERHLESYGDLDLLFDTNVTGQEVFGALSTPVVGTVDFNRALTADTKLSDLNNGRGVSLGSIQVSDGLNASIIDLSSAHTIGDVVALIEANPPAGRTLTVKLTPTGLNVSLDAAGAGDLRIKEVGGGTSARDLGILAENFIGTGPLVGGDLDPRLQLTTRLSDAFGARAYALIDSPGVNNALRIEATTRGSALNGYTVNFVGGGVAGSETVSFNAGTQTYTVQIQDGVSTATQVRTALNADAGFSADFTATLDTTIDGNNDGSGAVSAASTGTTANGSGVEFDQASGLQILNGDQVHVIDFSSDVTVEDLLNTLNKSPADVLAQLNDDGRTISIRSRLSGADFAIGENGGDTATQLGLRSLTTATQLADLNHGIGIHANETGDDFIIRRKDGVELRFDMSPASSSPRTIGDVINLINTHPDNLDPATRVVARLAVNGNGIELVDDGLTGAGQLTVLKVNNSQAAEDLGLIPVGQSSATTGAPAASANTTLTLAGANNDILFTATQSGPQRNGAQIMLVGDALGTQFADAFNTVTNTLTIHYDPASSTASQVIAAVNMEGTFTATPDTTIDATNDGSGLIGAAPAPLTTAGGASQVLTGRDTNPEEVKGVFNSLIRLKNALRANDEVQTSRAVDLVENDLVNVNFIHAEVGAREQSLDTLQTRLEDESIHLSSALSDEIDVDLAKAISDLVARQASLQAALQMTAQLSRITLLEYL